MGPKPVTPDQHSEAEAERWRTAIAHLPDGHLTITATAPDGPRPGYAAARYAAGVAAELAEAHEHGPSAANIIAAHLEQHYAVRAARRSRLMARNLFAEAVDPRGPTGADPDRMAAVAEAWADVAEVCADVAMARLHRPSRWRRADRAAHNATLTRTAQRLTGVLATAQHHENQLTTETPHA